MCLDAPKSKHTLIMIYNWKKITEQGQYRQGFIDVYEAEITKKAVVIINYLPQLEDKSQKVIMTLLLEGQKSDWSKATISNIIQDVEKQVKNMENFKFHVFNSLEYITIQTLILKNLEKIDFLGFSNHVFKV